MSGGAFQISLAVLLCFGLAGGLSAAAERDEVVGELRRVARGHRPARVAHVAPGAPLEPGPFRLVVVSSSAVTHSSKLPVMSWTPNPLVASGLLAAGDALIELRELAPLHVGILEYTRSARASPTDCRCCTARGRARTRRERAACRALRRRSPTRSREHRRLPSPRRRPAPSNQLTITGGWAPSGWGTRTRRCRSAAAAARPGSVCPSRELVADGDVIGLVVLALQAREPHPGAVPRVDELHPRGARGSGLPRARRPRRAASRQRRRPSCTLGAEAARARRGGLASTGGGGARRRRPQTGATTRAEQAAEARRKITLEGGARLACGIRCDTVGPFP